MIVAPPTTHTTLTGLNQITVYSISVSASTIKGDGPAAYIYIATGRNSEFPSSLLDFSGETKITMKKGKNTLSQCGKPKGEHANGHAIAKTMTKTVTRKSQNSCPWLGIVSKETVALPRREIHKQELGLSTETNSLRRRANARNVISCLSNFLR